MSTEEWESSVADIAEDFKNNVVLKDRKYRLKTYKNCFVGSKFYLYINVARAVRVLIVSNDCLSISK